MQQHHLTRSALLRIFAHVLVRRPLPALAIGWQWLLGRRVRARNRLRDALASLPDHYQTWLLFYQARPGGEYAAGLPQHPAADVTTGNRLLAVVLHFDAAQPVAAQSAACIVLPQLGPAAFLYVTATDAYDPAKFVRLTSGGGTVHCLPTPFDTPLAALRAVLDQTTAGHVLLLDPSTTLAPGAIETFARAAASDPAARTLFYFDQDEQLRGRRCNPWLKPEWDEDLFLAQDYISAACLLPADAVRRALATLADSPNIPDTPLASDLVARILLAQSPPPVRHIPYVAISTTPGTWSRSIPGRAALVERLLLRRDTSTVTGLRTEPADFGTLAIRWPLPAPLPRVSVIVPTRDRLDLLETCVRGVLDATDYPDIELIIADNHSVEPETLAFFEQCRADPRVRIVHWPHPYNYSAVNNFAAATATGAYLCLLNNDTEVIDPAWLREMIAHAVRPGVGAVGARLLYPDRSIQHAGVVIGMGGAAGHAHRALEPGDPGYFAQAYVARTATAVTAACLVVSHGKFDAVGGFDADQLAIAYNDVDLCLKLRAAGWRNMYVPQAVLIHHEGKSRGLDFAPEHLARYMRELGVFQERWGSVGYQDPTHHPALDLASEVYRLMI